MPFDRETAQRGAEEEEKKNRADHHSSKFPVRACALMQSRRR